MTLALGDLDGILKMEFSILFYWLVSSDLLMIMPSDECQRTLLMIRQHWFRLWLGAVRQQAITWANVDSVPCHLMASLGHNELRRGCVIMEWMCTNHIKFLRWNVQQKGKAGFPSRYRNILLSHQNYIFLDKNSDKHEYSFLLDVLHQAREKTS